MSDIRVPDSARQVSGRVISDRRDKTVTVLVERRVKHPVYGKYVRRSSRFHAHDADNACRVGDMVTIAHVRPLSRTKSWTLLRIDARADARTVGDAGAQEAEPAGAPGPPTGAEAAAP